MSEEHHQQDYDLFRTLYELGNKVVHPTPIEEIGNVFDAGFDAVVDDESDDLFDLENANPEFWTVEVRRIVHEATESFFREHGNERKPVLFTEFKDLLLDLFKEEENQDVVEEQIEEYVKEIKGFYSRRFFRVKPTDAAVGVENVSEKFSFFDGEGSGGNALFSKKSETWKNHISNIIVNPERIINIKSADDIVSVLEKGGKIKAHGSGHSYSSVCQTTGTLLDLSEMNNIIKGPIQDRGRWYIEVETGITVNHLVSELNKLNFALLNIGGYDGQTLAGVISTATHGSGISIGSFSDMVRVATVATNGNLEELFGTPAQNNYFYRITSSTEELFARKGDIKNDDLLNAVICSFGSMGLIYSVILEVQPHYYLYQKTEFVDTSSMLENDQIKLHEKLTDNGGTNRIELWTHPYSGKMLVVTREVRGKPPKVGIFKKFIEGVQGMLGKLDLPIMRLSGIQFSHPNLFKEACLSNLRSQNGTEVWASYEHILLTGLGANAGFAFELSIPISNEQGDIDLNDLATLIRVSTDYLNDNPEHPVPMFSIRFVAESNALVAMNSGTKIATIEYQMINPIKEKRRQILIEYLTEFESYLLNNEEVGDKLIIHWGLDFDQNNAEHFNRYAKSGIWKDLYASLNSEGSFSNKLTQQLKLDE